MTPAKPPRRRRWFPALPLGALALLAVLHGLAWHVATRAMLVGFSDWTAQRRAEGWTVGHDLPARGGWPLRAELAVPRLTLEAPPGPGTEAVGLDAARLVFRIAPPRLDRLVVAAEGPQRLRLGAVTLPFAAARLEALVPLEAGAAPRVVEVQAEDLRAGFSGGEASLRHARLVLAPGLLGSEPALLIDLVAEGLRPPPEAAAPAIAAFGPEIASAAFGGALTGPPPAPPSALRARAWRDAGGVLDLQAVSLRWGPLGVEGRIRLALDHALQPAGAGVLRLEGAPAAIAAMQAAGIVQPATARAAQGMAAMLSRVPPDGGPPRLEAPVAIGDGRLAVARLPLFAIAPLAWP